MKKETFDKANGLLKLKKELEGLSNSRLITEEITCIEIVVNQRAKSFKMSTDYTLPKQIPGLHERINQLLNECAEMIQSEIDHACEVIQHNFDSLQDEI